VDLVKLGLPRIDLMMFGDKSEQVGVDNVAAAEKEEKLDDATREGQSSRLLAESGFLIFFFFTRWQERRLQCLRRRSPHRMSRESSCHAKVA